MPPLAPPGPTVPPGCPHSLPHAPPRMPRYFVRAILDNVEGTSEDGVLHRSMTTVTTSTTATTTTTTFDRVEYSPRKGSGTNMV